MIFGIKSRSDLKKEIESLKLEKKMYNQQTTRLLNDITWFQNEVNKLIFKNENKEIIPNSSLLTIEESGEDLDGNNATLVCNNDNSYLYLSKKLTEGYTHLSINFRGDMIRFYLNNEGFGLEIDSNNRVKDKATLTYLVDYFNFQGEKVELIFNKIPITNSELDQS